MSLSPIKMFQSDQSSLAQILQGGNQTITSIMDKAIQIGRDMSNKQLSQERDLLAMRQQETNLMQRRAENTQQDIEDSRRFARGVFESNRNYGLNERQENRASAQQLFSQGIAERGAAVSEGGLKLRERELTMRGQEAEQRQAEATRNADYFRNKYEAGAGSAETAAVAPAPGSSAVGPVMDRALGDPATLLGMPSTTTPAAATTTAPAPMAAPAVDPTVDLFRRKSELQTDLSASKDPAMRSRISQQLGEVEGQISKLPKSPRAPIDPALAEKRQLDLQAARRKETDTFTKDFVAKNAKAFPPSAAGYERELQKLASAKGKKPEDVLWSSDFPENKRQAIIAAQRGQDAIEVNAINSASSEDAYVNLLPSAGEAEKELRRQLYRKVKAAPGTTSTPAAPEAAPSGVDSYLDKALDSVRD
jgi:hypothetical protein